MTTYNVFDGSTYGLTPVQSIDGTSIIISQENSIKVVNVFSASSVNTGSASASITGISYSSNGSTWTASEETQIQGITYALYKSVTNVVIGNPEKLIAVTIDIPNHTYTNPSKTYRKINFRLHLDVSSSTYSINLDEIVVQKGCDVGYTITYTVGTSGDKETTKNLIGLNVACFSGNTTVTAVTNPARMQFVVSRDTSFDIESDWNDYSGDNYLTYSYQSCSGDSTDDHNETKITKVFPGGSNVIPAGFYADNLLKKEYIDCYYPNSKTVVFVFDEPIKEIGYHTFCFSAHFDCKSTLPPCGNSIDTRYPHSGDCSSSLIAGSSNVTYDGKLNGRTNVTVYSGSQLEYIFGSANKIKTVALNDYVEVIGNQAFKYLTSLSSFTFGSNSQLNTIGRFAFEHTHSLTALTIPSTTQSIGEGAFKYSGLKNINIPSSLDRIECGVFRGCSGLTSITFSENSALQKIGTTAFYGCSQLSAITLPNSVKSIEKSAFKGCTALSSVTFGTGLRYIGKHAFSGTSIEEINLNSCNSSSGSWFTIDVYALRNLTTLKKVILPDYCIISDRSLACSKGDYKNANYIELEIGKHTDFDSDCFEYLLPVKKLTFRYESAGDIEADRGSAGGTTRWWNLKFPSTGATLYITNYIWEAIKQQPQPDVQNYKFLYSMWSMFIHDKHSGVFVKNADNTYTEKTW